MKMIAAFALVAMGLAEQSALSQSWKNLPNANFPALVAGIVFPGGNTMTASNPVRWGQWTVSLTPNSSAHRTEPGDGLINLKIADLRCVNPVLGSTACEILLGWRSNESGAFCSVNPKPGQPAGPDSGIFRIDCPDDIRFR